MGEYSVFVHNKCSFRAKLQKETGISGEGMDAHHIFPKRFTREFAAIGINNQESKYGAWVDASTHRAFSYAYNQEWKSFFDGTPTYSEAIDLAIKLAQKYGYKLLF